MKDGVMTDLGFTSENEIPTGSGTGESGNPPGPNPAWNDVLNILPTQFHSVVTPHFQKWDEAAQSRIESLNSQVQQFEAYRPLQQYGVTMDDVSQGLRLMHAVQNNPREIYDALGKAYGYEVAQQQLQQGNIPGAENGVIGQMTGEQQNQNQQFQQQQFQDPRVERLQQGVELMANVILQQQEAERAYQADTELDSELNALTQKYGAYDERYVLAMMQNGMTGDQAVQHFNSVKNELLQNNPRPFAPGVLGGVSGNGSGMASDAIDPTKLSGNETRKLVVEMLQAAARQQS